MLTLNEYSAVKKFRTGIVLSGGGARGFAHIGVLKSLNEHGIFPEIISAVSAGSIVGALYADGMRPDDIESLLTQLDLFRLLKLNRPTYGLLQAQGMGKLLMEQLTVSKLEDLKIPLIVCATNFNKAETTYFRTGPIVEAVLASSAIPLVLKPYSIDATLYVDGGLMNNLPVEPILAQCDDIIGVNVNPVTEVSQRMSLRNFADRVLHLAVRANIQKNIERCDIYIEPPGLMQFNLFKLSAAKQIIRLGYEHTNALLEKPYD